MSGAKKVFPCFGNVTSVNALLANTAAEHGTKQQEHWEMPGPGLLRHCYIMQQMLRNMQTMLFNVFPAVPLALVLDLLLSLVEWFQIVLFQAEILEGNLCTSVFVKCEPVLKRWVPSCKKSLLINC